MSQVSFQAEQHGEAVEVVGGWDHPLGYFFLVIFDGSDEPVYSNIDEDNPAEIGRDTSAFRRVLAERRITPPDGFWERVERKERNVRHRYTEGAWS